MSELRVVLSTFPSAEVADRVATALVDERLAACVNVVAGLTSIYRWQGAVAREPEVLAILKTTAARYPALAARLAELHPYDVPEVVALDAAAVAASYAAWAEAAVAVDD